jgi:hypothetical protein
MRSTGDRVEATSVRGELVEDPVRSRDSGIWFVRWRADYKQVQFLRPGDADPTVAIESPVHIAAVGITGATAPLAYAVDGQAIRAWSIAPPVHRWDLALEGIPVAAFAAGAAPTVAASPDGRWLAFRDKTGKLYVLDTQKGSIAATVDVGEGPDQLTRHLANAGMMFARDGTLLYLGHSRGADVLSVGDWRILQRIRPIAGCRAQRNEYMTPVAETTEGDVVFSMDVGQVCTIARASGAPLRAFDAYPAITSMGDKNGGFIDGNRISISADGARVALYNYLADRISVWDLRSGRLVQKLCPTKCGELVGSTDRRFVALSGDGRVLLTHFNGPFSSITGLWAVDTGRPLVTLQMPEQAR